MKVAVLFSGGKDSGLSAILLEPFFEELELVTFSFGRDDSWKAAADAAEILGHPHRLVIFDEGVLDQILVPEGTENVAVNTPIAVLRGEDEAAGAAPTPAPAPKAEAPQGRSAEG